MNKVDLTYSGKLKGLINVLNMKNFDVDYTIDGETGEITTTSILINGSDKEFLMITFNYQDLKKLVGDTKVKD